MRVLVVTQIYLPEMGALSNRLYPIIRQLVGSGHEVYVATGMPNYPAGQVFPEYAGKLWMKEKTDGYTILRTHYYTTPRNRSKLKQIASYIAFIPAAFFSGLRAGNFDLVLITSPPTFAVIPAIMLAKLRRVKLVLDVRDIWSDELVTYGEMSESSLPIRLARIVEKWGYSTAELIATTSKSLSGTVIRRGGDAGKVVYLPNGADLELFKPHPADNHVSAQYEFGDRFVVMYSGLFGIKHGLETFLEAAEILRDNDNICFFLIGNGARKADLSKFVSDRNLKNVIIANERPVQDIPYILARADACFAAVRPEQYPKKVISVKVFEYLACEKPVIGALVGESAEILERSGGGIVVPPGDSQSTAREILRLSMDPALRRSMGEKGRRFVESHFSRSVWAGRFEQMLTHLTSPAKSARKATIDDTQSVPDLKGTASSSL